MPIPVELLGQFRAQESSNLFDLVSKVGVADLRALSGSCLGAALLLNEEENLDDYDLSYSSDERFLPQAVTSVDIKGSTDKLSFYGASTYTQEMTVPVLYVDYITRITSGDVVAHLDELNGDGGKLSFYGDKDLAEAAAITLNVILKSNHDLRAVTGFRVPEWSVGFNIVNSIGYTDLSTPDIDLLMSRKPQSVVFAGGKMVKSRLEQLRSKIDFLLYNFNLDYELQWADDNLPLRIDYSDLGRLRALSRLPIVDTESEVAAIPDTTNLSVKHLDVDLNRIWYRNRIIMESLADVPEYSHVKVVNDAEKRTLLIAITSREQGNYLKREWEEILYSVVCSMGDNESYTGRVVFDPHLVEVNLNYGTASQIRYRGRRGIDLVSKHLSQVAKQSGTKEVARVETGMFKRGRVFFVKSAHVIPPGWVKTKSVETQDGGEKLLITDYDWNYRPRNLKLFLGRNFDTLFKPRELSNFKSSINDILFFARSIWVNRGKSVLDSVELNPQAYQKLDYCLRTFEHYRTFSDSEESLHVSPTIKREVQANFQRIRGNSRLNKLFAVFSAMRSGGSIDNYSEILQRLGFGSSHDLIESMDYLHEIGLVSFHSESGIFNLPDYVRLMLRDNDEGILKPITLDLDFWNRILEDVNLETGEDDFTVVERLAYLPNLPILTAAAERLGHPKLALFVLANLRLSYRNGEEYPFSSQDLEKVLRISRGLVPAVAYNIELHRLNMIKDTLSIDELMIKFEGLVRAYESELVTLSGFASEILYKIIERIDSNTPEAELQTVPLVFRVEYGQSTTLSQEVEKPVKHAGICWDLINLIGEKGDDKAIRTFVALDEPLGDYQESDLRDRVIKIRGREYDRIDRIFLMRIINKLAQSRNKHFSDFALDVLYEMTVGEPQDNHLMARYLGNTIATSFFNNRDPQEHAALAIIYAVKAGDLRILANNINNTISLEVNLPKDKRLLDEDCLLSTIENFAQEDNRIRAEVPDISLVIAWNLLILLSESSPESTRCSELENIIDELSFLGNQKDIDTILEELNDLLKSEINDTRRECFERIKTKLTNIG